MLGPRNFILLAAAVFGGIVFVADKLGEAQAERIALRDAIEETMMEPTKPIEPVSRTAQFCVWTPLINEKGMLTLNRSCGKPDAQSDA